MVLADVAEWDALNVNAHAPAASPLWPVRLVVGLNREVCWLSKSHDTRATSNVKCGGTATQDSQSEANEGAYPPLPPTTC